MSKLENNDVTIQNAKPIQALNTLEVESVSGGISNLGLAIVVGRCLGVGGLFGVGVAVG